MAIAGKQFANNDIAVRRVIILVPDIINATIKIEVPIENLVVRMTKQLEIEYRNVVGVSADTYGLLIAHLTRVIDEKAVKTTWHDGKEDWGAKFVMNAAQVFHDILNGMVVTVAGGRRYEFHVFKEDAVNPAILHLEK